MYVLNEMCIRLYSCIIHDYVAASDVRANFIERISCVVIVFEKIFSSEMAANSLFHKC